MLIGGESGELISFPSPVTGWVWEGDLKVKVKLLQIKKKHEFPIPTTTVAPLPGVQL